MANTRSTRGIGSWLSLVVLLAASPWARGGTEQGAAAATPSASSRPPLLVGVAIDEVGITQGDLQRSQDLVLAVLDSLPRGSMMTLCSFSGDKRIVLPPTLDRTQLATALGSFNAGAVGVALPDGLFDMVEYLASRDADARALVLVSAGRVREGDLQFEDPLNAATSKNIPIFALALGQGDGKLLRRVAKLTGGEYIRLEVADARMLVNSLGPKSEAASDLAKSREGEAPSATPEPRASNSLLGAAAVFFSLGGLLMLGIVVLLIRRMSTPARKKAAPAASPARRGPPPPVDLMLDTSVSPEDETLLEKTLVVNANPILRALSGPGAGKNFPLSPSGRTSLGRSRRNDIVVPEDAASAQHCRIDREGDSFVLHDLGATNGTWVNGAKTDRAVLQHGDRLKVGETVFTVSLFGDRS